MADRVRLSTLDGVNLSEGDKLSKFAAGLCRETYDNSPYVEIVDLSRGHFRGPRAFRLKNLPAGSVQDLAPDGEGTKPVLIDAARLYDYGGGAGIVAMTFGDITRWGGIGLIHVNIFEASSIGKEEDELGQACRTLLKSLQGAILSQGGVMYKGETAELGACVGSSNPDAQLRYLWCGFAIGAYNPKTLITGDTLEPGMIVIALKENGFRNNGLSTVRRAGEIRFGRPDWYTLPEAREFVRLAAEPAVLYDDFLARMNGWHTPDCVPIIRSHLNVHLTGGGLKTKFGEDILAPRGLSARLHSLWDPVPAMKDVVEWRGMPDEEVHEVLNGGQGELVVVENENDAQAFIRHAWNAGFEAKIAGCITSDNHPALTIVSKFTGKEFTYEY